MIYNQPELWIKRNRKRTITITGAGHDTYCYLLIDGVKYIAPEVVTVEDGTEITAVVGATNNSLYALCYIYVNDDEVLTGPGSYSHVVTSNCTIELYVYELGSRFAGTIDITEE